MLDKEKNKKLRFYILAVIILLIFLHYLGLLNFIERYVVVCVLDIQANSYTFFTKLKYSFVNYQEAQNYKKENEDLKKQLGDAIYENSQLLAYKYENEKLRASLNFLQNKEFAYRLAKVIGRDIVKNNTFIINLGSNDGVRKGYAVVVDDGILIGKVIEAKNNTSTILLLTDTLSQLAVSTIESNKSTGLAQGEYGLSIVVNLIPQNVELKENDVIITSGLEEYIPRGLVVGKVNRIISHENDLFKSATISPLVDYNEITFLSIIIPKTYSND
jgi:rod shape-determining protein MreC